MPPFARNPEIDPATFCRLYYETQIFDLWDQLVVGPADIHVRLSKADPTFHDADLELLGEQLLALNLELFGLAWVHEVKDGMRQVFESTFAKEYLARKERRALWARMGEYNQVVVLATQSMMPTTEPGRRAAEAAQNSFRTLVFHKWVSAGVDGEAAARAANRFFSDEPRDGNRFVTYLAYHVLTKIGTTDGGGAAYLNANGCLELFGLVGAMYKTARDAIRSARM